MPGPVVIVLSVEQEAVLTARVRSWRTEFGDRLRAQIVLAAARGASNEAIAEDLNVCVDTVRRWRARFGVDGLKGLVDRARSGRPPVHSPAVRAEVIALACALPAEHAVPLSRWSSPENRPRTRRPLPRPRLCLLGAPVAVRRCAQALATPVLDLHP